ncbi:MAG: hypothetical protein V7739_13870 [Motiliproteus sp.]
MNDYRNTSFLRLLLITALCALSLPAAVSAEQEPKQEVVMGYGEPAHSYQGRWLQMVYREAFSRIGIHMKYQYLPYNRLSVSVDSGGVDGELSRPYDYGFYHPNLVRIEPAHAVDMLCGISIDSGLKIEGWQSLNGPGYRIDFLSGDEKSHTRLLGIIDPDRLTNVPHVSSAMSRLLHDRSDLFIVNKQAVLHILQQRRYQDVQVYNAGNMESVSSHAYLHQRHRHLVPRLQQTLMAMKEEGLLEQYQRMALGQVIGLVNNPE